MNLETEIQKIHERNRKVEAHKAWEISLFRRCVIMLFTYGVAFLFMWIVSIEKAWLAAFVPSVAYLVSTLSVNPLKQWWIKRYYRQG